MPIENSSQNTRWVATALPDLYASNKGICDLEAWFIRNEKVLTAILPKKEVKRLIGVLVEIDNDFMDYEVDGEIKEERWLRKA